MPDKPADQTLRTQALVLVEAFAHDPSEENKRELERWSSQSAAHAKAIEMARHYIALSKVLRPRRLSAIEAFRLRIEVWLARLQEQWLQPMVVMLMAVLTGSLLYIFIAESENQTPDLAAATAAKKTELSAPEYFQTGHRQQRETILSDGSILWLDWHTKLSVKMLSDRRLVDIERGIVAFKVSHDANRPFVVTAGNIKTRVLGTEFVVNKQRTGTVEVAVKEGRVSVSGGNQNAIALNAETVIRATHGILGQIETRTQAEIGAWRDGLIVFHNRPLIEALQTIAPYSSYQVDASHLLDTGQRVSGTFFTERGDDALFTLLEAHQLTNDFRQPNVLIIRTASPIFSQ
ncbi:MAG: FecR domain-containing protein [Pseudomonadota bacterium]